MRARSSLALLTTGVVGLTTLALVLSGGIPLLRALAQRSTALRAQASLKVSDNARQGLARIDAALRVVAGELSVQAREDMCPSGLLSLAHDDELGIDLVLLTDMSGKVLAGCRATPAPEHVPLPPDLFAEGEMSALVDSFELDGRQAVGLARRIVRRDNTEVVLALATGEGQALFLHGCLAPPAGFTDVYIMDRRGTIVYHSASARIGASAAALSVTVSPGGEETTFAAILAEGRSITVSYSFGGIDRVASLHPIGSTGWWAAVADDAWAIRTQQRKTLLAAVGSTALAVLTALAAGVFASSMMVVPLQRLTAYATSVAKGRAATPPNPAGPLEWIEVRNALVGLVEAEQRAQRETVLVMVRLLETKDRYTRGHSERVTVYASRIGRQLGLDAEELDHLRTAAIVHDLGKVGVPDTVLTKPTPLTADDWQAIRCHPRSGADIVSGLRLLGGVERAVAEHHERYDGSGYPRGLKGEDIDPLARIIAVADAFDAMTSVRPYRPVPLPVAEALAELERGAGTQFDPMIVHAAVAALREMDPTDQPSADSPPGS